MILTLDNTVALTSDGEGLRSTTGNIGQSTGGGLFGEILSSQEDVAIPVDESANLLSLLDQDTAGGTLLPASGKALPVLEGSEIDSTSLELAVSLQAPVGENLDAVLADPLTDPAVPSLTPTPLDTVSAQPVNGDLVVEGFEKVVSPPLLAQPGAAQPIALDPNLAEQTVNVPKVLDTTTELAQKISASPDIGKEAPEFVMRSPIAAAVPSIAAPIAASITPPQTPLSATATRKPALPLQELGQKVDFAAKSDVSAGALPSAAGQVAVSLVQKPEMAGVFEDALAESAQPIKISDGISSKVVQANPPNGSQPLSPAMSHNASEVSSSSSVKATSVVTLPTPVSDPNWNQEFVGRIGVMVEKGVSEAKLQLTPAELGRMEVKISTDGDQTKILFTVQNTPAREAIEQAMPRLREMLGQEGLQLAHSEVADHSAARDDNRNFSGAELDADAGIVDEDLDEFLPRSVPLSVNTMVDYYV
ncbi:MAG: flagellar hook-length control protein FliK [Halioglobus sp.]